MYPMFNHDPQLNDPAFVDRVKSRRPATQLEILQRKNEIERQQFMAIADREARASNRGLGLSERLTAIRHSLSRLLISAGERIDPQAA